ncbi:Putative Oxalate decarboxylase family bicupin [[Torrubiella] hemipterigena]|uniref:Putative Oxalate decarboxylase family bicupin n=1 Tax=[Torrubiella] hemipterigena TaxID=1531966 RepID=A0A0A1SX28_9HYPO|nr:Putative Oxalate decarboxylase family bicupin [[Torrubiella] hemipterigena]
MKFSTHLLVAGAALTAALPHQDSVVRRMQKGLQIPEHWGSQKPYTPGFRDPYDNAVDPIQSKLDPKPWRNGKGASILGPYNPERSRQSPDMIRPPSTDHGDVENMRWSFTDSHTRIEEGGWTRQTTLRELPSSVELAGVNMRLDKGVIRELHWHKEAEWAYVISGEVRVTALDYDGGNFIDDLKEGDLWYFPSGVPHSLQGLGENGTEFLLIFDSGKFSEESTFVLTDWLAHTPKSVLADNFHLAPEVFAHLPKSDKYIFQGSMPGSIEQEAPSGKNVKKSKFNFTHRMLDQTPKKTTGGEVRIADSTNFDVSKTIASAHVTIQPGAMREMHWHPLADEWSYFLKGRARVTVFAAQGNARTFNYQAGDVGIVPANMGHFVENIGDEPLEMLEIFRTDVFRDFSLFQWMGETPQRLVADTIFGDDKANAELFLQKIKDPKKDEVTDPSVEL